MIARYKALIDDGFALPFGEALALEQARSTQTLGAVDPAAIAGRRAAIQARGRAQQG